MATKPVKQQNPTASDGRALILRAALAEKKSKAARQAAKLAKSHYKEARKAFKHARKLARQARKAAKAAAKALKDRMRKPPAKSAPEPKPAHPAKTKPRVRRKKAVEPIIDPTVGVAEEPTVISDPTPPPAPEGSPTN